MSIETRQSQLIQQFKCQPRKFDFWIQQALGQWTHTMPRPE